MLFTFRYIEDISDNIYERARVSMFTSRDEFLKSTREKYVKDVCEVINLRSAV